MMPNITRGDRMGGLMVYLAGPGRRNEHTEPHLVAGDGSLLAWHDDNELGREDALAIARHLDRPRRAFETEVQGGHVWHCSLSLRAEEGQLPDGKWREIAEAFVSKMGFDEHEGTRAPTRWAAVRHGVSTAGNDHVHVVVNLVREDGLKASTHLDQPRAQKACRELEAQFGLQPLEGASRGRSSRGYDPAEREADARRRARGVFEAARRDGVEKRVWAGLGRVEREGLVAAQMRADQPRWALARTVRACATASADEAEFVRRLRRQGVLVRARLAEGTADVITGYSVAERPPVGERPVWYGGGSLAHDLRLPRLRAEWPDTAQGASAAAAEWTAARRGRRPVAPGRETTEPDPGLWQQMGQELQVLREQLRSVPVEDRDTWARVARQTSGAFAAWSTRVEATPGPLAATADSLARSAELRRAPLRPGRAPRASAAGAAMLLLAASGGGPAAQAAMLRQLANLAKALHDMHRADQDARRAAQIEATVRGQLASVASRLPDPQKAADRHRPGAATVGSGQGPGRAGAALRSPVPNTLEQRRRAAAGRSDHGTER